MGNFETNKKIDTVPASPEAPTSKKTVAKPTPRKEPIARQTVEAEEKKTAENAEKELDNALERPTLSKSPEQLEKEHMKLLKEYSALSKDQLFSKMNSEFLKNHEQDGTLYILFLAIHGKDEKNIVEQTDDKFGYYKEMVANFIKEGVSLQKKLKEADTTNVDQLRSRMSGEPYGKFFKQAGDLPRVQCELKNLTDEQVRMMYETCVLEEHVRSLGIEYGGKSSYTTFVPPKGGWVIPRTGDCNAVAGHYACLMAFSGSKRLQQSMGMVTVDGHAQLCFDLGKDKTGKNIRFSKNTSYVDMSAAHVDPKTGKQVDKRSSSYAHNFYDYSHDQKLYGLEPNINTRGTRRFASSEVGELAKVKKPHKATVKELKEDLKLYGKAFSLNPHSPMACSNAMMMLLELHERKQMDDKTAIEHTTKVMKNYIECSHYCVFDIANMFSTFGADVAKPLIQQYEQRILKDEKAFRDYVRMPKQKESQAPEKGPNLTDTNNRKNCLLLMMDLATDPKVQKICTDLYEEFDAPPKVAKNP